MTLEKLEHEHQHGIFRKLRPQELSLLQNLYDYHKKSVIHSFHVASDCVYVAKKLGMSNYDVELLRIAALFHDIGKLRLYHGILSEGVSLKEQKEIVKFIGKDTSNVKNLLSIITLKDLIDYRSRISIFNAENILKKRQHLIKLGVEVNKSVLQHIREHVLHTEIILIEAGVDPKIIEIASNHHPEYNPNPKMNIYVTILSIVDKFNAMIRSEGSRHYGRSISRSEALDYLVFQMKQDKKIVKALAGKHLLIEAKILEPMLKDTIRHFYVRNYLMKSRLRRLMERTFIFLRVNRLFGILDDKKIKEEFHELQQKLEKTHH